MDYKLFGFASLYLNRCDIAPANHPEIRPVARPKSIFTDAKRWFSHTSQIGAPNHAGQSEQNYGNHKGREEQEELVIRPPEGREHKSGHDQYDTQRRKRVRRVVAA